MRSVNAGVKSITCLKSLMLLDVTGRPDDLNSSDLMALAEEMKEQNAGVQILSCAPERLLLMADRHTDFSAWKAIQTGCLQVRMKGDQMLMTLVGAEAESSVGIIQNALGESACVVPGNCCVYASVDERDGIRTLELLHAALFESADPRVFWPRRRQPQRKRIGDVQRIPSYFTSGNKLWDKILLMMKALLLSEYGRLEMVEVPMPRPGPEEVLIRVEACGICGSDVHGFDGSTGRRIPPIIMGHEAAGTITSVGAGVNGFREGARVTFDSTIYCGQCEYCQRGEMNLCENRQILGVSTPDFRRPGAFAGYVVVPERVLYHLPEAVEFNEAAMVEPLAVAVHAVAVSEIEKGAAALVVGAGMIGLLVLQVLKDAGCSSVIVTDIDDTRLKLAQELGATVVLNAKTVDVAAEVLKHTHGIGVDVALEAVGSTQTIRTAIDSVRKGGTVTLIGNVSPTAEIPLQAVVSRQLRLQGSAASSGEYPQCIDMLARGAIQVKPLITAVAPLEDGARWFERLHSREPNLMKIVLAPHLEYAE